MSKIFQTYFYDDRFEQCLRVTMERVGEEGKILVRFEDQSNLLQPRPVFSLVASTPGDLISMAEEMYDFAQEVEEDMVVEAAPDPDVEGHIRNMGCSTDKDCSGEMTPMEILEIPSLDDNGEIEVVEEEDSAWNPLPYSCWVVYEGD